MFWFSCMLKSKIIFEKLINNAWGKYKINYCRVGGFICDKNSYYTSTSNCPIRKLSLWHVSMKLIAISRLTSSISEPAFLCNILSLLAFPAQYLWLREFRLGINNFQPKVECGEARSGSVAAEGRWVYPKKFQRRSSFSVANPQMLKRYRFCATFILSDNLVVYMDD
jgi:hypothetical protein